MTANGIKLNAAQILALALTKPKMTKCHWRITWIPEDTEHYGEEQKDFIGTRDEAESFAEKHQPDFLCLVIEFERRGEANSERR